MDFICEEMLEVIFALVVVLFYLSFRWRQKNISVFSNHGIPGPKPSLLFGNLVELYRKGPMKCHQEWIAKYGRVLGYYYGMRPILLVSDPQKLKTIYIRDFSKFVDRVPLNQLQDHDSSELNLLSITHMRGQKWKQVRSALIPSFSTAKIKKMSSALDQSLEIMVSVMRQKAQLNEVFNISDTFQRLAIDVIGKTAFGVVSDVQTAENPPLLNAARIVFRNSYRDVFLFIGLCFPSLKWLMRKLQFAYKAIQNRGKSPTEMLAKGFKRVAELRRNNPKTQKPDILQLMLNTRINVIENDEINVKDLEAGKDDDKEETENTHNVTRNLTNEEVLASSVAIFLAAFETTSSALSFTSYLLAKHPDAQERIFEEVSDLIKCGEKLEYASVNKLPYLDKVLSESLRLYPPVTLFVNRFAAEDVNYGDLKIPKDMYVQAPVYIMHHDPEFWQAPEDFQPERFDAKQNSDGITYFPFGIGPRNCMGMRFAQMEAKIALAHIVRNFRLELSPSQKDRLTLQIGPQVMRADTGVYVKLHLRDHESAV